MRADSDRQADAVPAAAATHAEMSLGAVRLIVADLDRAQRFYEYAIGLRAFARADEVVRLGVDGQTAIVELVAGPTRRSGRRAPPASSTWRSCSRVERT